MFTNKGQHALFLRGIKSDFQFEEFLPDGYIIHYCGCVIFFDSIRWINRCMVLRRSSKSYSVGPVDASVPAPVANPSDTVPNSSEDKRVAGYPTVTPVTTMVSVSPAVPPGGVAVDLLL